MNRQAYSTMLAQALRGVSAEAAADLVSDVEQHFADGLSRGRSEEEIAAGLGSPQRMAAEYRTALELDVFQQQRSFGSFLRLLRAIFGTVGFNLVLSGPTLVVVLLCGVLHLFALSLYLNGALLVAGSLTGVDRLAVRDNGGRIMLVDAARAAPAEATTVLELAITKAGIGIVEPRPTSAASRPTVDIPSRLLAGLLGAIYLLLSPLLWNLGIRFDRRAIVWLAQYARINQRMLADARGVARPAT